MLWGTSSLSHLPNCHTGLLCQKKKKVSQDIYLICHGLLIDDKSQLTKTMQLSWITKHSPLAQRGILGILRSGRSQIWRSPCASPGLQSTRKTDYLEKMHQIARSTFTCCRQVTYPGSAWLVSALNAYRKGESLLVLWQWWPYSIKICSFQGLTWAYLMVHGNVCGSWRHLGWAEMRREMGRRGEYEQGEKNAICVIADMIDML